METNNISKSRLWTGRTLSGLFIFFMLFDVSFKFVNSADAATASAELGYKAHHVIWMAILALIPTILYIIPRTSVLGAILLTAYLGGAIATHFRLDNPLFSHVLFPVYLAIFMWGGIWLRDERIRRVLPVKQ